MCVSDRKRGTPWALGASSSIQVLQSHWGARHRVAGVLHPCPQGGTRQLPGPVAVGTQRLASSPAWCDESLSRVLSVAGSVDSKELGGVMGKTDFKELESWRCSASALVTEVSLTSW